MVFITIDITMSTTYITSGFPQYEQLFKRCQKVSQLETFFIRNKVKNDQTQILIAVS